MRSLIASIIIGVGVLAAPAAGIGPSLMLSDQTPLTVVGHGFVPGERVTVSFTAPASITRSRIVSPAGRFVVVTRTNLGRCQSVIVRAVGANGDRAVLRFIPECMSQ